MKQLFLNSLITMGLVATQSVAHAAGKPAAGQYNVDGMHSSVGFEIPHLVISSVEGKFKTFSGNLNIDPNFSKSSLSAEVDIASIDTAVTDRDNHLKSPDFFDVAKHPKMSFKSTSISGNEKSFKLVGDLTIKGITKKVTFTGSYKGSAVDGYGNNKAAFVAETKISRKDFGLTWNSLVEAGPVVGDEVTIKLKIQAAQVIAKK